MTGPKIPPRLAGLTGLVDARAPGAIHRPLRPLPVRPKPGDRQKVIVATSAGPLVAAAGRSGLSALKREGDGATPVGRFHPIALLFRPSRVGWRAATLPHRAIGPRDAWSDDPRDVRYNTFRQLPFHGSHEALIRADHLYDIIVVLDHNQRPRVRGAGSAVFVHVARPDLAPTAGCLAFEARDWRRGRLHLTLRAPLLIGVDPRPCRALRRSGWRPLRRGCFRRAAGKRRTATKAGANHRRRRRR